ncbi:conjugal transfer protein TraD (plasmid) [Devosia sp. A8/3-2]|nr:conjugal transfer protein TraD [Devosia sp. A8/3-2]
MQKASQTADRKKDTREKIQLGGLIAKAGLRYEKRALLLGLLIDGGDRIKNNPSERERLLALGIQAFGNDPE